MGLGREAACHRSVPCAQGRRVAPRLPAHPRRRVLVHDAGAIGGWELGGSWVCIYSLARDSQKRCFPGRALHLPLPPLSCCRPSACSSMRGRATATASSSAPSSATSRRLWTACAASSGRWRASSGTPAWTPRSWGPSSRWGGVGILSGGADEPPSTWGGVGFISGGAGEPPSRWGGVGVIQDSGGGLGGCRERPLRPLSACPPTGCCSRRAAAGQVPAVAALPHRIRRRREWLCTAPRDGVSVGAPRDDGRVDGAAGVGEAPPGDHDGRLAGEGKGEG